MGHLRAESAAPLLPYAGDDKLRGAHAPSSPLYRSAPALLSPRRMRSVVVAVVAVVSFGLFAARTMNSSLSTSDIVHENVKNVVAASRPQQQAALAVNVTTLSAGENATVASKEVYPPWVLGAPTKSFRDNLLPDQKYISSWLAAGWNNDVMTVFNLIYLGHITDRVTIIPMFTGSWHVGGGAAGLLRFGDVFDVPRFIRETKVPILEWHEVKDPGSEVVDEIGCWNVWQSVQFYEAVPRGSDVPKWLKLDISYTQAPDWVKMMPGNEHNKGAGFWDLARLAYPEDRNSNLGRNVLESPEHKARLDPDEHMLCYDYLYYVGGSQDMEYDYEYGPAWRYIGKQMHWKPQMETLAMQYVNRALGLPVTAPTPRYITVHVRHGDFIEWCWDAEKIEDCFAPLPVIARRVNEVQTEIQERFGEFIPMERVIMTSDESDEAWWQQVAAYGWKRLDHDTVRTAERFTRWHPLIIDSIVQSNGLGFVGTDRSTFSVLSRRRVLEWNDGSARMVFWGKKGADDH